MAGLLLFLDYNPISASTPTRSQDWGSQGFSSNSQHAVNLALSTLSVVFLSWSWVFSLSPQFSAPRYYFKKVSDEFDCGVVFEEVREDEAILPVFEEKIIGKVEKVD